MTFKFSSKLLRLIPLGFLVSTKILMAASPKLPVLPLGQIYIPGGPGVWSTGTGVYKHVTEWDFRVRESERLSFGIPRLPNGIDPNLIINNLTGDGTIVLPKGDYRLPTDQVFHSDGVENVCTYATQLDFEIMAGAGASIYKLKRILGIPQEQKRLSSCSVIMPAGKYKLPNNKLFKSDGKGDYCAYATFDDYLTLGGKANKSDIKSTVDSLPTGVSIDHNCPVPEVTIWPAATDWALFGDKNSKCHGLIDSPIFLNSYKSGAGFGLRFGTVFHAPDERNVNQWVVGAMNANGGLTVLPSETCRSIISSGLNPNFNAFDGSEWLVGTYNTGTALYGMLHNEYYGGAWGAHIPISPRCPSGNPQVCWYSSVGGLVWNPASSTFIRQGGAPKYVVARPLSGFNPNAVTGYWTNTNIVKNEADGYYYMYLVNNKGKEGQVSSPIRTKDLSDPTSWRGWDGKDFTVNTPAGGDCARVTPILFTYIGYNTYLKKFIGVGYLKSSITYATSSDLVNWSDGKSLGIPNYINGRVTDVYPSFMDLNALANTTDSNAMSGALTGQNLSLLYVHFGQKGEGHTVKVRRLKLNPDDYTRPVNLDVVK